MRIGIDATKANERRKTGTEWYATYLLRAMRSTMPRDVQVELYTSRPLDPALGIIGDEWHDRVLRWPLPILWYQGRLSLRMLTSPPDVLFIPAHTLPRILPKVAVTTIHDIGFEISPELYSRTELLYHRWSYRHALRRAERIITPSQFTKDEILKRSSFPADHIVVIPHGPIHHRERLNEHRTQELLRRIGVSGSFLLSVGRLEEKKGTALLVDAYAAFRRSVGDGSPLVLAGSDGYGAKAIHDRIRRSGFASSILTPGYVDADTVTALMTRASLYAFPSKHEGFGFPILECFDAGVPMVVSRAGSLPEVGGDAVFYADPTDSATWAEAMQRLLSDEQLRASLVAHGKQRLAAFSWEHAARDTIDTICGAVQ